MLKFKCNKNFKLAGLLAVVAAFAGCAGAIDDAADSSAPSVKLSTPAQGATNVNVRTAIQVVMSESVDPSTVTHVNVVLKAIRSTGAEKVTGAVSYDAGSKTITFTPSNEFSKKAALGFNERYRLTLANIQDRAGNSIVLQHIEFQTTKNLQNRHYNYDATNVITSFMGYNYNANGSCDKFINYTSAGTGTWTDGDEVIGNYYGCTFDTNGKLARVVHYTAANAGTWFDGDETISDYVAYIYNTEGYVFREATYTAVGATGNTTWFDGDDVGTYTESTYYFDGTLARRSTHGPGLNGKLFDSDDVVTVYTKYTYDESASLTGAINYNSAGSNGTWFDADDIVSGYTANVYDATSGYQTQAAIYTGAGADKQWFTNEDIGTYSKYSYSADGTSTRITFYAAGGDIKLFTIDDVVTGYYQYTYAANGPLSQYVNYSGAGIGNAWFDGNDVTIDFAAFKADASGNIIRRVNYNSWGLNGSLFNDDDVVAFYEDHIFDASNNREQSTYYSAAGTGGWFAGSDIKSVADYYTP